MIPVSSIFDQPTFAPLFVHAPVAQRYRAFHSFFDESIIDRWDATCQRETTERSEDYFFAGEIT